LEGMPARLAGLPRLEVDLHARNVLGLDALESLHGTGTQDVAESPPEEFELDLPELPGLLDELSGANTGLVLVVGKGGVGKTSLAAAIAVGLADRGHQVQLATTDPAAHLDAALPGGSDGIRVSRIDPGAENLAYQERVLMARGPRLDEEGRAAL